MYQVGIGAHVSQSEASLLQCMTRISTDSIASSARTVTPTLVQSHRFRECVEDPWHDTEHLFTWFVQAVTPIARNMILTYS